MSFVWDKDLKKSVSDKDCTLKEGTKYDEDKVRLDLLPMEFMIATAKVLMFGAKKYEEYNWAKGMNWSRVYSANQRHMLSWWAGEKADPETGYSHLWHAACCLCFLIVYEIRGLGKDDRYVA